MHLPDVNVWLAMAVDTNPNDRVAQHWLARCSAASPVAFCRVTQMGLLRLLTQRAVMNTNVQTQSEAWQTFDRLSQHPGVRFIAEPTDLDESFRLATSRNQATPKLWTDDYLVAFARSAELTLVTFDRALASRSLASILLTP